MNAQRLLGHYERIAHAPDAIARLRRFILDLAVRGKLVPQDANDEPASELLKRIAADKARLVKSGDIRHQESGPDSAHAAFPVISPTGWAITRLATISRRIHYGYTASADGALKDVRMLRITDIQENAVDWSSVPGCLIEADEVDRYKLDKGDILIARTGGTIGKTFLVRDVPVTTVFASYLIRIQGTRHVFDEYLKLFLESPLYWTQLREGARGTGQPNVNGQTLGNLILSLPPLAEQHRIVAKVDELMALCDRLEAARVARENTRDRLTAASLARLNAPDPDTFQNDARFALDALPALTTRPDQIKQMRHTILNLAVRGKLVPQDPGDEPASELLRQILAEKALLAKAGKAKESKLGQTESGDEPFDVPWSWRWTKLGELAHSLRYGTSAKCSYENVGVPVLRIPNVEDGRITIQDLKFGPLPDREAEELRLRLGDILMVRSNGSLNLVGRPALVEPHAVGFCYAGYLVRVRLSAIHLDAKYLVLALNSAHVRDQIELPIRTTVGLKNVNATELSGLTISLPPLAEQHRIVAKVDELMALCDRLEASLTAGEDTRRRLLNALLHEALAPVDREMEAAE